MNRKVNAVVLSSLFLAIFVCSSVVRGEDQTKAGKVVEKKTASKGVEQLPFLGVGVEPVHPGFWSHLKDLFEHKYGVMVTSVLSGSPADKAGIKPHDILLTFGNQKLFSPYQLHSLVHAEKVGNKVDLDLIRAGTAQSVTVTLGTHTQLESAESEQQRAPAEDEANENAPAWTRFDSINMKSLGNDRYQVEIGYETKEGKIEHLKFEGTREEIRKDILTQKDLPESERNDLLRSLDLTDDELELDVPDVYITPDGQIIWDYRALRHF